MIRALIVLGLAAYGTVKLAERFASSRPTADNAGQAALPKSGVAAMEERAGVGGESAG
jgi:hypothetical protein